MKVYVDENDIKRNIITYCNGTNTQQGLYVFGKDKIEVLSLTDYTKRVRKEVLSELMNMLGDRAELIDFGNGYAEFMFTTYDLQECSKEILDQIEQGKQND